MMTRQLANRWGLYDKPVNVINKAGSGGVDGRIYAVQRMDIRFTNTSHAIAEAGKT